MLPIMGKNNAGALSRDDLAQKLQETAKERASLSAKVKSKAEEQVDRAKEKTNIDAALDQAKGFVQQKKWLLIYLTTGQYILQEAFDKRGGVQFTVQRIMSDPVPLGRYNKDNIVSMEIFNTKEEAMKKAEEIKRTQNVPNTSNQAVIDRLDDFEKRIKKLEKGK